MGIKERRRAAVDRLITDRFNGVVAAFALKIERSPAQVWQFMNSRAIGEKLARDIELKCGLPQGALDADQAEPPALLGAGLLPDEAEAILRLRAADPSWRSYVLGLSKLEPQHQQILVLAMQRAAPQYEVEKSLQEPLPLVGRTKSAGLPRPAPVSKNLSRRRKLAR